MTPSGMQKRSRKGRRGSAASRARASVRVIRGHPLPPPRSRGGGAKRRCLLPSTTSWRDWGWLFSRSSAQRPLDLLDCGRPTLGLGGDQLDMSGVVDEAHFYVVAGSAHPGRIVGGVMVRDDPVLT